MIMLTVRVDKDVINEDYDEHVQVLLKYMIHQVYESYWGIVKDQRFIRVKSLILAALVLAIGLAGTAAAHLFYDIDAPHRWHRFNRQYAALIPCRLTGVCIESWGKILINVIGDAVLRDRINPLAMDHLVNSATKAHYMSSGNISVLVVFRGPNGAALGVGAQHSQYSYLNNVPVYNQYRSSAVTTSSTVIGGGSEGGKMVAAITASSSGSKDEQMAKNGMDMVILQYL
ncbi:hypothetical protein FXO38_14499 [Capsicum annuum]|nr:hypothetical protein FXO38_14499 [Capsicum annuum]